MKATMHSLTCIIFLELASLARSELSSAGSRLSQHTAEWGTYVLVGVKEAEHTMSILITFFFDLSFGSYN